MAGRRGKLDDDEDDERRRNPSLMIGDQAAVVGPVRFNPDVRRGECRIARSGIERGGRAHAHGRGAPEGAPVTSRAGDLSSGRIC